MTLFWIILFCLVGGLLSVIVAASLLVFPLSWRRRLVPHLLSFAIGALLGAAFLVILPHAFENPKLDVHILSAAVLLGILGFFLLEKMVLWRHCHSHSCDAHTPQEQVVAGKVQSQVALIVIGDGIHNFIDGIMIAAAFLTDFHLGVATSIALAAHEIPQEVGDFAILLNAGVARGKALLYNALSGLTTVLGGVLGYFALGLMQQASPYVMAVAAASFIYIAVADLIPNLHQRTELSETVKQVILILLGVAVIWLTHLYLPHRH